MVLYINCVIHAPGVKFGHAPGVDSLHRLTMGKKIFFSETTRPTALIFCMWQWLMVLYINCANHVPGVKFGHTPGVDSLHRPTIGKIKLEDHWSCSSPERLSHCKLMRFKLIENRPMKVYAWTLLTPRGMAKFDPGA